MNDSLQQLSDLEIYVRLDDLDAIIDWLGTAFSLVSVRNRHRHGARVNLIYDGHSSDALITLNAGKSGFTSIWINSHHTPWADDIAMARDAFAHFGKEVRCIDSAWQEGDDPDRWLAITGDGERVVHWPNG